MRQDRLQQLRIAIHDGDGMALLDVLGGRVWAEVLQLAGDAVIQLVRDTAPGSAELSGGWIGALADSSKLQFTIEPTHVHKDASILAKVDYRLSCTGTVDILPGFPVTINLTDSDGNVAEQIYNIEQGVRRGSSEPKFLHVGCGDSKAGDTAKLKVIGDAGGAAQNEFNFTLTWKEDGTADVTPA